ncbi:Pilus assembly protein, PilO [Paraliobacillus sp. PM-2]|uniref:type 4a pilus biogenesis protein PilO n=1 Tax=Paraliobacillus sp. PM-2 TaxID=1462524 RepID=UPI00061C29F5|nr:type 4a pilus biogenesis protein PilO [Paraliobacillus sp. PM-2]CQR48011.1 Pilus assembly protein, PilO [Paraliobacillus sp. PM-2]
MTIEWNKKYSIILVIILLLLVLGSLFSFYHFVYPVHDEVEQLETEIATQNQLIEKTTKDEHTIEEATEIVENLQQQLPNQIAVDQLLLKFKQIEEASGVTVTKITKSEEDARSKGYSELLTYTFQVDFDADNFNEMNQFLTAISNNEQLMELHHIEFTNSINKVNATTTITTFYQSE